MTEILWRAATWIGGAFLACVACFGLWFFWVAGRACWQALAPDRRGIAEAWRRGYRGR